MLNFNETVVELTRLTGKGIRRGNGYMFHCPCHNDPGASLSVTDNGDGKALIYCFAGCAYQDIVAAIQNGISIDYYTNKPREETPRKLVKTYVYTNVEGLPLFRKLRFEPKTFAIQSYVNGKWVGGLKCAPVLYQLPRVVKAKTVFILEGEKAVDALAKWGFVGTCSFNGGSKSKQKPKWQPELYNKWLAGKNVVLLPDNDDPGRAHMEYIYSTLNNVRLKKIVSLPGIMPKADFYDWQEVGWTKDEFVELVVNY